MEKRTPPAPPRYYRPFFGNAGVMQPRYGTPTGPKPTADEQANLMRPTRRRGRRRGGDRYA